MASRSLHLNVLVAGAGAHAGAWRVSPHDPARAARFDHYLSLAALAERGALDALLFGDGPGDDAIVADVPSVHLDAVELAGALAGVTSTVGLVAAASTTYTLPYDVGRRLGTLDFFTAGRAGWHVVTTPSAVAAARFGIDREPTAEVRLARADEHVEATLRLWDGWEDDALVAARDRGIWADRDGLHPPGFRGEHFHVAGLLPFSRSPQGRPVIAMTAGSSAARALAARRADVVAGLPPTLEAAVGFRRELRAEVAQAGREPDAVRVLPAIAFTLAETAGAAIARRHALDHLAGARATWDPVHRTVLDSEGASGDPVDVVGTPAALADALEAWWRAGAADGFTLLPAELPRDLELFVAHVVPLLRRRGLVNVAPAGATLRERYGLARPAALRSREVRR